MAGLLAKVSREELAKFLLDRAQIWKVDAYQNFESQLPHLSVTVEELLETLLNYDPFIDYVYVFSDAETPYDIINAVGLAGAAHADASSLDDYVIRGRGKDYLWISPTDVDAENAQYITLIPVDDEESGDEETAFGKRRKPLVTRVAVENFKGIGEPVEIELKPITLLFGPNSAGKSSILHALHYAREIFERRNLDADQTAAGGTFVDLGGFRNFVHNRDLFRPIRLTFDLDLSDKRLPTYITPEGLMAEEHHGFAFDDTVKTARVAVAVYWSDIQGHPYVREYAVDINGLPLARIESQSDGRQAHLTGVNYSHPVIPDHETLSKVATTYSAGEPIGLSFRSFPWQPDALPQWERALPLANRASPEEFEKAAAEMAKSPRVFIDYLIAVFSQLIVGPGQMLRDWLKSFRYLGPFRETPTRTYSPPKSPDPSRWASGIAAWDLLTTGPDKLVADVSDWLSQPDRLNAGYRVERRRYKRLDLADPLIRSLVSGRAFDDADTTQVRLNALPTETQVVLVSEDNKLDHLPPDVGIGISQILPVVVAAAADDNQLVVIEQPELHVHPRLQAALGDLIIETALNGSRDYLIETHSEHLMLRILRRIRETSEEGLPPGHPGMFPEHLGVLYVEPAKAGTAGQLSGAVVHHLRVDRTGEFVDRWPSGFFEERAQELF